MREREREGEERGRGRGREERERGEREREEREERERESVYEELQRACGYLPCGHRCSLQMSSFSLSRLPRALPRNASGSMPVRSSTSSQNCK